MINSILASIGRIYKKALAKTKDWCGVLQKFSKVANMTNPNTAPAAFSHAMKNIFKNDKNQELMKQIYLNI